MATTRKPKILMLGWEYPPLLSGGLGIASQGLGQALAPHTELEMVVPMTFPEIPNALNAKGLNQVDYQGPQGNYPHLSRYTQVAMQFMLDPYAEEISWPAADQEESKTSSPEPTAPDQTEDPPAPFFLGESYGKNLPEKVMEYGQRVTDLHREDDFDLIHVHDWMTALPGIELKQESGKPLVLHVHSLAYDRSGSEGGSWIFELEREAMEMADLIITVSQYTAEVIVEYYGIDRKKIHPVHNGIEAVQSYRLAKPFPEKLITFLGRLVRQKGPDHFIQIAQALLEQREDVRFVIAGSGNLSFELMEQVARAQLADRIHFTGFLNRNQVGELLAMSDLMLMPSLSEPFGLAGLEAAQFGVPVLLSHTVGLSEVLPEAPCIAHWDTQRWIETCNWYLDNPIAARELGSQLERRSREQSWEKAAQDVLHLYADLLST